MSEIELDRIDREILRLLQKDAELSAAAVGEKIGLSQGITRQDLCNLHNLFLVNHDTV